MNNDGLFLPHLYSSSFLSSIPAQQAAEQEKVSKHAWYPQTTLAKPGLTVCSLFSSPCIQGRTAS